jgi:alkylated DNA repair protein alkB family protein 8
VEEMVRILQSGGKALIYVWAKDQQRHNTQSSYLKQDRKNRKEDRDGEFKCVSQHSDASKSRNTILNEVSSEFLSLPVHKNRTQFQHQDLLVPWKLKPEVKMELYDKAESALCLENSSQEVLTFYRYYHLFEEGELELLCSSVKGSKVVQGYYDQGNWCIVLEKL